MSLRPATARPRPRALGHWLLVVALLVFAIVVVGGVTRLTESGLSITEWKPIRGTIPPLTQAEWQAEFDGYKAIPQYQTFNQGMTLDGFKRIFFWEYLHRLLARTIGTVLALILITFWWRRWIPRGYGWRTWLIFALGGLQGLIGWWMVASGLQNRTEVSHLRLATHLLAAMLIYGVLIWTALDLFALARAPYAKRAKLKALPALAILALAIQLALGAFTAGLRAGYAFSSWPLMGGSLFPAGGWQAGAGALHNLVSNPVVVQFVHRWWAFVAALLILLVARKAWRRGAPARAQLLLAVVALQITLGIVTLLSGVDIVLAVAHQAGAALLLAALIWTSHTLGSPARR
ncbi:COX15/CtaA family protein [Sphingomonas sp. BIUV-7]|uniref:Heme A synthase n=1 Tax=Sphingomonas natans TaxID=3063330 RepID=A0ABT8Y732_9SPHN|nr:COX15/CtaA family protein [Sphingomonas sp. BIUV-7]MDO6413713.1 COX15/CtaA family protein [Sphingomonas sp. BIUV-7]